MESNADRKLISKPIETDAGSRYGQIVAEERWLNLQEFSLQANVGHPDDPVPDLFD